MKLAHTEKQKLLENPAVRKQVRSRTNPLNGQYGYTRSDLDDIEQDCMLKLLVAIYQFDPARTSLATFVDRVLTNHIRNMIEKRKAHKRDYRRPLISLHTVVTNDGECAELGDIIATNDYLRMMGKHEAPLDVYVSCEVDLRRSVDDLAPEYRDLCEQFLQGKTVADIVRDTDISRSTIYRRLKNIRAVLS